MSKFFNIDDWETVDVASTGAAMEIATVDPVTSIGFSVFMSGEAGTPTSKDKDNDNSAPSGSALAGSPSPEGKTRKKSAEGRNIFIGMAPPKPSWVQENY